MSDRKMYHQDQESLEKELELLLGAARENFKKGKYTKTHKGAPLEADIILREIDLTNPVTDVRGSLNGLVDQVSEQYAPNYVYMASMQVSSKVFNYLLRHPATTETFPSAVVLDFSSAEKPAHIKWGRWQITESTAYEGVRSKVNVVLSLSESIVEVQEYAVEFVV